MENYVWDFDAKNDGKPSFPKIQIFKNIFKMYVLK